MKTTESANRAGRIATNGAAGKTTTPMNNAGRQSKNTQVTVELCPQMFGLFSAAAKEHECTPQEALQLFIDRAAGPIDWQNTGFRVN